MKALASAFGPPPAGFIPQIVGIGAGTKDFHHHPNIVRLVIGTMTTNEEAKEGPAVDLEELMLLETNIDDMNAQVAGYVCEILLERGALDVWNTAIQVQE